MRGKASEVDASQSESLIPTSRYGAGPGWSKIHDDSGIAALAAVLQTSCRAVSPSFRYLRYYGYDKPRYDRKGRMRYLCLPLCFPLRRYVPLKIAMPAPVITTSFSSRAAGAASSSFSCKPSYGSAACTCRAITAVGRPSKPSSTYCTRHEDHTKHSRYRLP